MKPPVLTGKIGAPLLRPTDALKTVGNRVGAGGRKRERERKNVRSWKAKGKERGEARNCRFHSDLYLESSARSIQGASQVPRRKTGPVRNRSAELDPSAFYW